MSDVSGSDVSGSDVSDPSFAVPGRCDRLGVSGVEGEGECLGAPTPDPSRQRQGDYLPHPAHFTPHRRACFAQVLASHGNVRLACGAVRVSPETAYKARRRDAAFAAAWDGALVLARAGRSGGRCPGTG